MHLGCWTMVFFALVYNVLGQNHRTVLTVQSILNTNNTSCGNGSFSCANGNCIHARFVCDHHNDCGDKSDERGCRIRLNTCWPWQSKCNSNRTCSRGYFQCRNGKCIAFGLACNRKDNCGDGSDEIRARPGLKCSFGKRDELCVLPQMYVDDGVTHCDDRVDICLNARNQSTCFTCMDKMLIISNRQVCDGVFDCFDLSDECLCEMPQIPDVCDNICTRRKGRCKRGTFQCGDALNVTVNFKKVCDRRIDCPNGRDEQYCRMGTHQTRVVACPADPKNMTIKTANLCDGKPECYDLSDECGGVCSIEQAFCKFQNIFLNQSDSLVYRCGNGYPLTTQDICDGTWSKCQPRVEHEESQCDGRHFCGGRNINSSRLISYDKALVCDGYRDCADGSDEWYCPQRFNCTSSIKPSSVPRTFTFDDFNDCVDGSDECPPYLDWNWLSSRNEMISVIFFRVWVWIMAVMALLGNGYVIAKTCQRAKKLLKASAVAKANHFLVFNLAVSDFLMGVYLICIAIYSAVFSGRYCYEDEKWRTGSSCQFLGGLSVVASEASVLILAVMTCVRLYSVFMPFRSRNLKFWTVSICVMIVWGLSVCLAVLPMYALTVIDGAWLPSKFFNSTIVPIKSAQNFMDRMEVYVLNYSENATRSNGTVQWSTIQTFLNVHSPKNRIMGLYGYYSSSSVCISRLFVTPLQQGWRISITIVSINFFVFVFIALAYLAIYKRAKQQPRKNDTDRSVKMQSKIFRLVTTDFFCWVPICIMAFIHFARVANLDGTAYVIVAVVLMPINSVLNPLLYSNALDNLLKKTLLAWRASRQKAALLQGEMFQRFKLQESAGTSDKAESDNQPESIHATPVRTADSKL
nr:G-protein coupled receptor GRL101 precursor-like isoform X1 [Ciona intestinalis]|eukprot:XP_009859681.2 G-protein coupled receptor GRL101 precursor-like isoform X1 [Ciona intestinalis]